MLRLLPALNLTDAELDEGCDILEEVLLDIKHDSRQRGFATRSQLTTACTAMRHFLDLLDLSTGRDLSSLLGRGRTPEGGRQRGERPPLLPGRVLGLIFEKPSLRTRVSFEAAMAQLGGASIFLSGQRRPASASARACPTSPAP